MFTEERYNIILQELDTKGIVSVTELVKLLDVSESTIRRDLNSLDDNGMIKKIHGGAISIGDNTSKHDYKVNVRKTLNMEEKQKIAKHAGSLIENDDIIYLDAGTTTELIIDYIENDRILVVTNGIDNAKKLLEKGIKTFILGGEVKEVTEAIVGSSAVEDLKKYNFSKGFFGTNGVSNKSGYTTPDASEAMVKREAIKRCTESYILADESKLDEVSFITFANISDSILITSKTNRSSNYDTKVIGVE
ncbi:DeoR/GlpR family DNA-binding transcription regulator [Clostridium sp. BJN0001]|uniref:DeoR/GlpR family DNA-binding transcription regulator n=1 Tax=Clostridium sp. BJN0001 TaxID=2930219 RepID=UPI001FD59945|nr:DeoR/GlpR family DNA-binding transcription regulator [Clostridium sp. BJN0001]